MQNKQFHQEPTTVYDQKQHSRIHLYRRFLTLIANVDQQDRNFIFTKSDLCKANTNEHLFNVIDEKKDNFFQIMTS